MGELRYRSTILGPASSSSGEIVPSPFDRRLGRLHSRSDSLSLPGLGTRFSSPVACRYTDLALLVPHITSLTYLLTYLRSWALLEEPLIGQPLKNFPAFHGTRRFNTVFTRSLQWSLSWAISIQSTPSNPISLRPTSISSTHLRLGLQSGLFPSGFPTNIL
jgi:hypothetical protein